MAWLSHSLRTFSPQRGLTLTRISRVSSFRTSKLRVTSSLSANDEDLAVALPKALTEQGTDRVMELLQHRYSDLVAQDISSGC